MSMQISNKIRQLCIQFWLVIYCAARFRDRLEFFFLKPVLSTLPNDIILASSSRFRRQQFERLHLPYRAISPDVDESVVDGESASRYVQRLAHAKAHRIATQHPEAIVIGSDQCALLDDKILGKPGNSENALRQLRDSQGKSVMFHTGLCVLQLSAGFEAIDEVLFEVRFRQLEDAQLRRYLEIEQPYDCAGSFKSEGYGVCLFSRLRGDDPSALIGLPLIRLTAMLESAGVRVV